MQGLLYATELACVPGRVLVIHIPGKGMPDVDTHPVFQGSTRRICARLLADVFAILLERFASACVRQDRLSFFARHIRSAYDVLGGCGLFGANGRPFVLLNLALSLRPDLYYCMGDALPDSFASTRMATRTMCALCCATRNSCATSCSFRTCCCTAPGPSS